MDLMNGSARIALLVTVMFCCGGSAQAQGLRSSDLQGLDSCNVSWDTPGPTSLQSMPIGNGDIGLNVWVEPNGDLDLYIGKTDAWSSEVTAGMDPWMKQGGMLSKLGLVRVSLSPNPLGPGSFFRQTLRLREGEILIREGNGAGKIQLRVWVDANHPVIRIEASSARPVALRVSLDDWRIDGGGDTVISGQDNQITDQTNRIAWYHRNGADANTHLAGLSFGAVIKGNGFRTDDDTTLRSKATSGIQLVSIYPFTARTASAEEWKTGLKQQIKNIDQLDLEQTRSAHRKWWDAFWHRSWVFVHGDSLATGVTQGYVLQRFVTACAGRGAYPIKFNGSIFVVDHPALKQDRNSTIKVNADYRGWGGQYWFQNTRPMYWPRLMAGDFDEMMPLFNMYAKMLPANAAQVRDYYHHGGAYFAETAPFWGGLKYWGPEVKEDWTGHYFTPILELSMMMLDYYEYTGDKTFAREILLPVASAGLNFFDQHFGRDAGGKLLLDPDNSIEMFWKVHDPAPDIAGLHAVLRRMLALPEDIAGRDIRNVWSRLLSELPELPGGIKDGAPVLLPYTGRQTAKPRNLENPELYAIYPFRLYGLGKPDLDLAINTFNARAFRDKGCWVQDPIQAAMLGLADVAKVYTAYDLTRKDPDLKFPAFWVQGHDYMPDEDNGGNGENGLQEMLMQTDGKKILLLPAWPKGWDVEFKLHAPYNTTVEGRVVRGKLTGLKVFPASRKADIIDCLDTSVSARALTSYVDPMIGAGGHGHVFVGASVPFGAVQVGPNNIPKGWDWCSGYHYSDSILIGFSQMHLSGTGIGDLGDVLIMPFTGPVRTDKGTQANPSFGYASRFSHSTETARPGYYSVKLDDHDIRVELTASERVGFHRYYFPLGKEAHVIVDLKEGTNDKATDTYIEQSDAHTLKGYRLSSGWAKDQRVYFAIRSDAPITKFQVYDDSVLLAGGKGKGKAIKGLVTFEGSASLVQWKVGISPVSADNALANIEAEIPGWDFDAVVRRADELWNKELSKIKIETKSGEDKRVFYTALYHTMIDPSLFNDHNGDYRGTDKRVYPHASFQNYTVFSLWDTYRALNPLYTLIQPERVGDIVNSMLAICHQQGKLPVWHLEGCETNTMPGVSSVQVVAEAYLKGLKGFDPDSAYEAVKQTMMNKDRGLEDDQADQYIPSDKVSESVARGLEYSISNASIALMAKKMGRQTDFSYYQKRFHNFGLYYDPVTGFFRGKRADGTWDPVFDPARSSRPWINDLSEGNHWQYLWLVPEDVEGLIRLLGGDRRFVSRLDSLFTLPVLPDPNAPPDIAGLIGQYAHGDEPGHHTIYLYAYAGRQWQTAEKARYILKNLYPDNVDGLSGNEDCGQMSAWYIFSALGFYPVFPANGGYVLGSPLFDKASIDLGGGKSFTVETEGNSPENIYIQSVEWNGKPYPKSYILHKDILGGGVLKIRMGPKPNEHFGRLPEDRPRSVYP